MGLIYRKLKNKFFVELFHFNLRGLISAREFGEVFPDLRSSTFIPSSIYHTSKQVSFDLYVVILWSITIITVTVTVNSNFDFSLYAFSIQGSVTKTNVKEGTAIVFSH